MLQLQNHFTTEFRLLMVICTRLQWFHLREARRDIVTYDRLVIIILMRYQIYLVCKTKWQYIRENICYITLEYMLIKNLRPLKCLLWNNNWKCLLYEIKSTYALNFYIFLFCLLLYFIMRWKIMYKKFESSTENMFFKNKSIKKMNFFVFSLIHKIILTFN